MTAAGRTLSRPALDGLMAALTAANKEMARHPDLFIDADWANHRAAIRWINTILKERKLTWKKEPIE